MGFGKQIVVCAAFTKKIGGAAGPDPDVAGASYLQQPLSQPLSQQSAAKGRNSS
jgi:hypothetical protein